MEESIHNNFMWLIVAIELWLVIYLYRVLKKQQLKKKSEPEKKII